MRIIIVKIIDLYQKFLSPDQSVIRDAGLTTSRYCSFYPTCSEYAKQAVIKYGVWKGVLLGIRRVLRCHPWQNEHFDPVK